MAIFKITLLSFFVFGLIQAEEPSHFAENIEKQILYSLHTGDITSALELYQKERVLAKRHDMELLEQIGLTLLDKGFRSSDLRCQVMTLLGAGISFHEKSLYILEDGLSSSKPELQIIALNFLAKFHNDRTDEALNYALADDHLIIRLEALFHLAENKHPKAVHQIEALMAKVPPDLHPLFPQLLATVGNARAMTALKKMVSSPEEKLRVAAILAAAKFERDDLLPQIRKAASQHSALQQEACAIALGLLMDEYSIARLKTLSESNTLNTKLAALQALYRLGKKEFLLKLETLAKEGNLFAIAMLQEIPESKDVLAKLCESPNLNVRLNAAIALLELRDERCLKSIGEVLIRDSRDLIFVKTSSLSGGLSAWKAVPSASHNLADDPVAFELSLSLRESVLRNAIDLPRKYFLQIADALFETHQNDLVPTLCELLENGSDPQTIALLKKHAQKPGAPLIRNYCSLGLYNLRESGPYEENLRQWILKQQGEELIRLRPYVPWGVRDMDANYAISPHETSKLLIAIFESFARSQDDKGLDVLVEAISTGNTLNRYALAGLLIRAAM